MRRRSSTEINHDQEVAHRRPYTSSRPITLSRIFIPHSIAIGLLLLLATRSFPMMYPGYDIWWHLDVIRTVEHFDGQSYGRWHWMWNRTLFFLGIDNLFSQALFIHRIQFSISILSIYGASLLLLSSAFKGKLPNPLISASLSALSVTYWLVMHGTSSRAPYLGADSSATMSWINWYSVSHQIALPLYVLATALMIHAIALARHGRKVHFFELALSLLLVIVVGLLHAAEVPYFLFMAGVGITLYTKPSKLAIALIGAGFLFFAFSTYISKLSHGDSALLVHIWNGEWDQIWSTAQQHGELMIRKLNRAQTSWNLLYTISLVLLLLLIPATVLKIDALDLRVLLWICASAALPAAIYFKYPAGILSQVTYLTLAWRFSFGSLLFIAPSIYLASLFMLKIDAREHTPTIRLATAGAVVFAATLLFSSSQGVIQRNAYSIVASLDMDKMHFGISASEQEQLSTLSQEITKKGGENRPCFDLFTAYYLYYLFNTKDVCLPGRIIEGPTHQSSQSLKNDSKSLETCSCSFSKDSTAEAYRAFTPTWNYKLLK